MEGRKEGRKENFFAGTRPLPGGRITLETSSGLFRVSCLFLG